jgi:hypothetical protein
VEVVQGYREFSSDAASIDRSSRTGVLEGNIEVREPGVLLRGERGEYTSATGEAQLENSRFVLHEQRLRGSAALLSREADERIRDRGWRHDLLRAGPGRLADCRRGSWSWMSTAVSASPGTPPCGAGVPGVLRAVVELSH